MTTYKKTLLSIAVCIGISSSPFISAKTTNSEEKSYTLDEITVYADAYRTAGTKTSLAPQQAPMSYTRIDSERLETRHADSVNQALRYEPGWRRKVVAR